MRYSYPWTQGEAPLRSAIIEVSQELKRFTGPGGGICYYNPYFIQRTWSVGGQQWRLDIDNLAGCNLVV